MSKYRELCAVPPSTDPSFVPLLYPHAFLVPLHLALMTHEAFPLSVLGSVHLRNHVVQHAPLRADEAFDVALVLGGGRRRPQGLEFDLSTSITVRGAIVWTSVSTFLVRQSAPSDESALEPESELASAATNLPAGAGRCVGHFDVPAGAGKEYGWLTADLNPIHTSCVAAKLFGFERDLAHGMWGLGRALGVLRDVDVALSDEAHRMPACASTAPSRGLSTWRPM